MEEDQLLIHLIRTVRAEFGTGIKFYKVPSNYSKRLIDLFQIKIDLARILLIIDELRSNKFNETVAQSLNIAMISLYGRCFTDASNAKAAKLEPSDCFPAGQEELLIVHNEFMKLRHNFTAHRGKNGAEVEDVLFCVDPEKRNCFFRTVHLKKHQPESIWLDYFEQLVKYLLEILEKKTKKANQKAYDAVERSFNLKTLKPFSSTVTHYKIAKSSRTNNDNVISRPIKYTVIICSTHSLLNK